MREPLEDVRELDRLANEFAEVVTRRINDFLRRGRIYATKYGTTGIKGVRISDIRRILLPIIEQMTRKTVRRSLGVTGRGAGITFALGRPFEHELVQQVMANYSRSLYFLERDMRKKVERLLRQAMYEGWDEQYLRQRLKRELKNLTENRMQVIARTELQNIYLKVREKIFAAYEKRSRRKILYKWVTAHDSRVCEVCHEIERRTRNGVTLEELKRIIREVVTRHGLQYNPVKPFTPHPNDRCVFVIHKIL